VSMRSQRIHEVVAHFVLYRPRGWDEQHGNWWRLDAFVFSRVAALRASIPAAVARWVAPAASSSTWKPTRALTGSVDRGCFPHATAHGNSSSGGRRRRWLLGHLSRSPRSQRSGGDRICLSRRLGGGCSPDDRGRARAWPLRTRHQNRPSLTSMAPILDVAALPSIDSRAIKCPGTNRPSRTLHPEAEMDGSRTDRRRRFED